ncbi:MAG: serine protease [Patescibacteria group bacterium]|nr:serine protease [Patescibacteria group bacterium]
MVAHRLTTFGFILTFAFVALVSCADRNREATVPIRVQRVVPDTKAKLIIKLKTDGSSHSVDPVLPFKARSADGRHKLALDFRYNEKTRILTSSASGVMLTHDGLILTNHHVTRTNPSRIEVILKQGKNEVTLRGQLVTYTPFATGGNDMAVIRVNAHFDDVVRLGEGRQVRERTEVYNYGFPFGLSRYSMGKCYQLGHISRARTVISFFSREPRFIMGIRGVGGVSGSGIYAQDGRLIGIMQGHTGFGRWMVGIPVNQIRRFLDERGIPYSE